MYAIKQMPEDFVVEEIMELKKSDNGKYTYFSLKKKNLNSEQAIQDIAAFVRKPRKWFGYSGNKDKQAITTQYCSFQGKMGNLSLPGIEVKVLGNGDEEIHLGMHTANRFIITVRNLASSDLQAFQNNCLELRQRKFRFANYFDSQRFSSANPEIGKAMIVKDFEKAASLVSGHPEIQAYLDEHPRDFVGALRRLPQKTLQFYIHAYQSKLWNMLAAQGNDGMIPLLGFGTEKLSAEAKKLLADEGITLRDFIIRQLPVSAEGHEREYYAYAADFQIVGTEDDELNKGKSKITLSFTLPKASYATILVRELFKMLCN
jgi:tRNA pseudouridine13 synthase